MTLIRTIRVAGVLALALFAFLTVQGQQTVDFGKAGPADRDSIDDEEELEAGPADLPVPPARIGPQGVNGNTLQLMGFTEQRLAGGRGVLNLSLACRQEFPNSRMCTAEEISLTMNIPDAPGFGHAWVQPSPWRVGTGLSDCGGWSSSVAAMGLAIFTGPCTQCYGGYTEVSCSMQLSVACCGLVSVEQQE